MFLDAVGRTLRKTEDIMEEERRAKANGEVYMPDSALGTSEIISGITVRLAHLINFSVF